MIGELCALIAAACWAVSGLILKRYTYRVDSLVLNAYRLSVAAVVYLVITLPFVRLSGLAAFGPDNVACLLGAAVVGIIGGDTIYVWALRLVPVSVAYPIVMSGYAVFTFAISAASCS